METTPRHRPQAAPTELISWFARWTTKLRSGSNCTAGPTPRPFATAGCRTIESSLWPWAGRRPPTSPTSRSAKPTSRPPTMPRRQRGPQPNAGRKSSSPVGAPVRLPSTGDYLKGMAFALAMGGAARTASGGRVPLRSCIGFLNTIARSKAMTSVLQSKAVREWVAKQAGDPAPGYRAGTPRRVVAGDQTGRSQTQARRRRRRRAARRVERRNLRGGHRLAFAFGGRVPGASQITD